MKIIAAVLILGGLYFATTAYEQPLMWVGIGAIIVGYGIYRLSE